MTSSSLPRLVIVLTVSCCEPQDTAELPTVVAESRYIEYSTWADDTAICMGDFLRDRDDYIDDTATFLSIAPPAQKIRYVWIPEPLKTPENWLCDSPIPAAGCQTFVGKKNVVFSSTSPGNHHELVHAIVIGELGRSHPLLEEGLAEYLGSFHSSEQFVADFPNQFRAMLDRGTVPDRYLVAMQYVGSVLTWYGVENFKDLMELLPRDAGFETLAQVHKNIYGEDLNESLAKMDVPIVGRLPLTCEGEPLFWSESNDLEITVQGVCGDGRMYGPGFVAEQPAFYKEYVLDVPASGVYGMSVRSVSEPSAPASASMWNCPGVEAGSVGALTEYPGAGRMYQGPHRLVIGFPQVPEAKGEVLITLRFQGDPDAAPTSDATVVLRPLD